MPRITMRGQMTGTRNGADWPPPGEDIDVTDDEAATLIDQGMAEPAEAPKTESAAASQRVETAAVDTKPASRRR